MVWGLRVYGKESEIVWGGDKNCQHEWGNKIELNRGGDVYASNQRLQIKGGEIGPVRSDSNFCVKCGAWRGQLGLEPHPMLYIEHLVLIFREVKRVLKRTGSVYVVLGDTFAGSHCARGDVTLFTNEKRQKVAESLFDKPSPQAEKFSESWLRPKQQLNIPFHVAFALQQDGWIQRGRAIWHKPNAMPGSQKDRLTCSYEFIFHFVKNDKTLLWRNMETGEWRSIRPVQQYVKYGGIRVATFERPAVLKKTISECSDLEVEERKIWRRLWMGFDYYYELDAIRKPHTSLKDVGRKRLDTATPKHDLAVQLGAGSIGPSGYLVQHPLGKNPGDVSSFNLRVRDVKRGKGGLSAQGELKASEKEVESYQYPERGYHGKFQGFGEKSELFGLPRARNERNKTADEAFKGPQAVRNAPEPREPQAFHPLGKNPGDVFQSKKEPYVGNNPHRMRLEKQRFLALNSERPEDLSHPLGKNPGDVIRQPKWDDSDPHRTTTAKLHREGYGVGTLHPLGKNPGDIYTLEGRNEGTNVGEKGVLVDRTLQWRPQTRLLRLDGKNPGDVVVGYNSKYFEPHGQTIQGFIRSQSQLKERLKAREVAKQLFPNDPEKQQEYINFVHDHYSDPKGPNPRDIIKIGMHHGSSLTTGRATHYKGQAVENHPFGKNPGDAEDFWSINTKPYKGAHFAVYPVEICIDPILSSCPLGGVVLDPMCGSGSTLVAAKQLGRKFIGIDINGDYVKLALERLAKIPEPLDAYLQ